MAQHHAVGVIDTQGLCEVDGIGGDLAHIFRFLPGEVSTQLAQVQVQVLEAQVAGTSHRVIDQQHGWRGLFGQC